MEQPIGENQEPKTVEAPEAEPTKEISFREALEANMAKADAVEDKPEPQKVEPNAKETPESPQKQEVPPPVLAPADMTPQEKEMFSKADPVLQSYLSRRAHDIRATLSREMQKIQDKGKHYEAYEKALEPHREYLERHQLTPDTVIRNAIGWDKALSKTNPSRVENAKEWLAAQGIDVYELVGDEAGQPRQQQQAPAVDPQELEAQIWQKLERRFQQQQEAQTTEQNFNVVQKFLSSKPLFRDPNTAAQIEAEMAPLVAHYVSHSIPREEALEKAYNVITQGNETYRALLDAYNGRERAQKAQAEAAKARQASRSVSGSIAGANPATTNLSFRDELKLRMSGGL